MTDIDKTRIVAVASLAYHVSPGKLDDLKACLSKCVPEPLSIDVAGEVILQAYLFFGYPQAIEALRIFSAFANRLGLTNERLPENATDSGQYRPRGEALCRQIYHPNYNQLIENMVMISPELADWMVVEGYGKVLSRPGPTSAEREIASIVFLIMSGHPVQLFSHVRGARNLGLARDLIVKAIDPLDLTEDQRRLAGETLEKVF